MFVDFGYAERYDGNCYLRFDDTNPEAEKQEYIDHIQDIVSWMGYKPYKVSKIYISASHFAKRRMTRLIGTFDIVDQECDLLHVSTPFILCAGYIFFRLLPPAVRVCSAAYKERSRLC